MALNKEAKQKLIRDFARDAKDTGSTELQVALLTEEIRLLTGHLQMHKRDFSCKRGLLKMVARRKGFLDYLAKNNVAKYQEVVSRLGLKR